MDAGLNAGLLDSSGRLTTEDAQKYRYYRKTFLYATVIAVCITLPFVLYEWIRTGHGVFLYYGDYNAQQLAFYRHCVDMVHSGDLRWDWYTDLGSNFVASYSYYMLGSPFFWFMCLFPASWAPYLMGPVYILKYITAAMLAFCYLKRWTRNKDYAVLGALLYAFCGFQIYNTFFNQFHEVVAFFPLLLIGMEELVQNNRRGLFALAVCLNAMINYFMFAGQVAFCVIYFMFRFSDKSFGITLRKFLSLALEAVIGFAMSMVLFLPGALGVVGNDRINGSFSNLKDVLFYWKDGELYWQRYGQVLESYFFPPDIPSRVNFFYGHTERWASISGFLPLFGMTGVFSLFTVKKRGWVKGIAIFLVVCSFVPGLNALFYLGRSAYYARWMYMMVLMFVVGTVLALDSREARWKGALAGSLGCILAIAVPLGLFWYDKPDTDAVDFQLGRAPYLGRFWVCVLISLIGIVVLWQIVQRLRGTKRFANALLIATSVCIVAVGVTHIESGKEHSHSSEFMMDQVLFGEVTLPDPTDEFYRMDLYCSSSHEVQTLDNLNIYWHYPGMECFHTVVPPSIMNFYDLLSYNRSVGSRTSGSWYGVRGLTSTKYSFIEEEDNDRQVERVLKSDSSAVSSYETSSNWQLSGEDGDYYVYVKEDKYDPSHGWTYYDTQNGFDIYQNDNYVPMGFCFDEFMTESEFMKVGANSSGGRAGYSATTLLMTYLVVPDDMADYYAQFMTEVKEEDRKSCAYDTYAASVVERRESACTDFQWGSDGFSAHIEAEKPRIVFFSVPAEEGLKIGPLPADGGWKATVNGEAVEVLTVDGGFVAVEVPAGASDIAFTYRTNGLGYGLLLTVLALLGFAGYLLYWKKCKKERATYRFFREDYYDTGVYVAPDPDDLPIAEDETPSETPSDEDSTDEDSAEEPSMDEDPPPDEKPSDAPTSDEKDENA